MSYTAELKNVEDRGSSHKITVEYTDGTDVRQESFRFNGKTKKDLINAVRAKAAKRDEVKTVIETVDFSQYIGQILDLTPPPTPDPVIPPEPTAEEIAKSVWFADWRTLNRMLTVTTAIPALTTTQANTAIANLRASLETDWLNIYLEDI